MLGSGLALGWRIFQFFKIVDLHGSSSWMARHLQTPFWGPGLSFWPTLNCFQGVFWHLFGSFLTFSALLVPMLRQVLFSGWEGLCDVAPKTPPLTSSHM